MGAFLFAADEIILPLNKPIAETPNKPKGNPFKNDLLETLLLFKTTSQLQKYTNQNSKDKMLELKDKWNNNKKKKKKENIDS